MIQGVLHTQLGLPPAGKTYEVVCPGCDRLKWPYLSNPPGPDWICGWCAQAAHSKYKKRKTTASKPKKAKTQMPKVRVKRRAPKAD